MSKFSVGNKVKILDKSVGCSLEEFYRIISKANYYIIDHLDTDGDYVINVESNGYCFTESDLELYNKSNNKTMENVKEKFVALFIKEPEKTFRKAGITNGDGFLTEEGQSVFLGYLLNKHGVDFKSEVVDEIVKEEKGDK